MHALNFDHLRWAYLLFFNPSFITFLHLDIHAKEAFRFTFEKETETDDKGVDRFCEENHDLWAIESNSRRDPGWKKKWYILFHNLKKMLYAICSILLCCICNFHS